MSPFHPPWWLRSRHGQTLWPALVRRKPRLPLEKERLILPDGDFLDLVWTPWRGSGEASALVLILHGLEGSSESTYAAGMLDAVSRQGWQAVLMHFRGCSGEANRARRSYHSGETDDLQFVAERITARYPGRVLFGLGFSLGGNVLLKWLGERGSDVPLRAAIAISVPFDLACAAKALGKGFSRLYQWWLMRSLVANLHRKFSKPVADNEFSVVAATNSFWHFDDRVTAPLHGFANVHDYYAKCSSKQFLCAIRIPTLLIQSRDDPFLPAHCLPDRETMSEYISTDFTEGGGHVGFVCGNWPWQARYWLEPRSLSFLRMFVDEAPLIQIRPTPS